MWRIFILYTTAIVSCDLEVSTNQGKVVGRRWITEKGRKFEGFTGIPYAEPPVGKLRFQAAVPVKPWNGVLDATKPHNPCVQVDYFASNFSLVGHEDCLYLNVYKPLEGRNLPVMFYIHGGSFNIGSGADNWLGPKILLESDIVLVIINYRLGALGFLSTEDTVQPGNNGLKDQALALKWVKENIAHFGGNPAAITVFGNSAGGMSAHYFTMSPLTKHIIAGAIIQSGSATTVFPTDSKGTAKACAANLGMLCNCPVSSSRSLMDCLTVVNVLELIKNEYAVAGSAQLLSPFQPIVEVKHPSAFISEHPAQILKSKNFANVPLAIGIVEHEGAFKTVELNLKPELLQTLNDNFTSFVSSSFPIDGEVEKIANTIRQFYFGNETINHNKNYEITKMFSDGWFLSSLDLTLSHLLQYKFMNQQIYVYLFGYRGSVSYTNLYGLQAQDYGVCHTDELLYLLPRHIYFPKYRPTPEDSQMEDAMRKLWVDFAKTGKPTAHSSNLWQPLSDEKLQYLHIRNPHALTMEQGLFANRRMFWRENVYQSFWKKVRDAYQ